MTTAVLNREVSDIFSNYYLKGGQVPRNLPPKNEIMPKSSKYAGFNLKSRNFFVSETFRFSFFSFIINFSKTLSKFVRHIGVACATLLWRIFDLRHNNKNVPGFCSRGLVTSELILRIRPIWQQEKLHILSCFPLFSLLCAFSQNTLKMWSPYPLLGHHKLKCGLRASFHTHGGIESEVFGYVFEFLP